jgi:hypothetical protein
MPTEPLGIDGPGFASAAYSLAAAPYAVQVSAGSGHACAVMSDGSVQCWGEDYAGETRAPAGTFVRVIAGPDQTCAFTPEQRLVCWGNLFLHRPNNAPGKRDIGFSTGSTMACEINENGELFCDHTVARVPFSTAVGGNDLAVGDNFVCVGLSCWSPPEVLSDGERDPDLIAVSGPSLSYTGRISAGGDLFCAIRSGDGAVFCWSFGWEGNRSDRVYPGPFTQVSTASEYICAIRADGSLHCWGDDTDGQTSPPSGTFTQVSSGYTHACGIRTDGALLCWGRLQVFVAGPRTPVGPYTFTGFRPPVNGSGWTIRNGGANIPLKFGLGGNHGLHIFASGSPRSRRIDCSTSDPLGGWQQIGTPGRSGLKYTGGEYHINWKTEKGWKLTCRELSLVLSDGSEQTARIRFR